MSDREAFEKWIANKTYVIETPDVRINAKEMAWEAWQAAQAHTLLEVIRTPPAAVPEGYVLVPTEATEAMIEAGVDVAFAASVHGKGGWNNYMKTLYRAFIAAQSQEQK